MKKTLYMLLLTVILITFTHTFYGQLYFSNNCKWNNYWIDIRNNHVSGRSQHFLKGDTIINGKSYYKLYYSTNNFPNNYEGAIREENGQIYALMCNYEYIPDDEILLYNFNLKEGDIFQSNYEGPLSKELPVLKIDTITLQTGEKRKRFFLTEDTWIEGIGSLGGLLFPITILATNYEVPHVVCVKKDNDIVYRDEEKCNLSWYNCCEDISMTLKNKTTNNISVSPQLIKDFATLTLPLSNCTNRVCKIYNNLGNIVQERIIGDAISELDFSRFPQGIYLVVVFDGDLMFSCKVMKE